MKPWHLLSLFLALALATCTIPAQPQLSPFDAAPTSAAPLAATQPVVRPEAAASLAPAAFDDSLLVATWNQQTNNQFELKPIDARTGLALPDHAPLNIGRNFWQALSPDGRTLALVGYDNEYGNHGVLHLLDLAQWTDEATDVTLTDWASAIVFNAGGSRLALSFRQRGVPQLALVDVQARPARLLAQAALDFDVRRLAFLPDGALAAYGRHSDRTDGLNPETRVAVLDGETLSEQWQAQLPAIRDGQYADLKNLGDQALHDASVWWTPAAVFAPDASRLYVLHADSDTLTTVDFSKRSTTTAAVAKPRSFLQRLLAWAGGVVEAKMMNGTYRQGVLSADGTRLYTVGRHTESAPDQNGNLQMTDSSLGLQVIDAATATEVAHYASEAQDVMWTSGRKYLLMHGSQGNSTWTDVIDPERLELVKRFATDYVVPAQQVNGAPVLLVQRSSTVDTQFTVLDPGSLGALADWTLKGYIDLVPRLWSYD